MGAYQRRDVEVDDARLGFESDAAKVICGDAFDLAATLALDSIDCVITSPPYWGLRTYGFEHNWDILAEWRGTGGEDAVAPPYDWYRQHGGLLGLEPLPEWYVSHLAEIFERLKSAMTPGANLWGENINWLSEKIEGPNIANVFKRTFYQMVLKFKLAGHETCAGTTLALPRAVWDSWQRHLGLDNVQ